MLQHMEDGSPPLNIFAVDETLSHTVKHYSRDFMLAAADATHTCIYVPPREKLPPSCEKLP